MPSLTLVGYHYEIHLCSRLHQAPHSCVRSFALLAIRLKRCVSVGQLQLSPSEPDGLLCRQLCERPTLPSAPCWLSGLGLAASTGAPTHRLHHAGGPHPIPHPQGRQTGESEGEHQGTLNRVGGLLDLGRGWSGACWQIRTQAALMHIE